MRILVTVKSCEYDNGLGGMGRACVFNYDILKSLGHDVHVVSPNLNTGNEVETKRGITFYCGGGKPKTYTGEFFHKSRDIVNKLKPDLIVSHSGSGQGVVDLKIPKIFVSHGHGVQFTDTYLLEHFLISKKGDFKTKYFQKTQEIWNKSRNFLLKFNKCVFLTETSMRQLRDRFMVPQAVYIPLSVDETKIFKVEKEYDVVVCANALSMPYKGFNYAKKVIESLGIRAIIIGATGKNTDKITYTGHLNKIKDVYTNMCRAKVSLELSYHQSGLNMVKLESLYNRLPIIGWNVGSSYATIDEDKNGYIVPFGDMNTLKERILRAKENHKRLSCGSVDKYNSEFSNKWYIRNWEDMILGLVK